MPQVSTLTPLKAIFRFPFQGAEWRNRFLVGTVLMFAGFVVPIVPLIFVYGYALQVMRQAIEGQDLTLPAWTDFNRLGKDGLRGAAVSLVFMLPGALVSFGGMALYMGSIFAMPLMVGSGRDPQGEAVFVMLLLGSMAIMFLSMAAGTLLSVAGMVPIPVATAHMLAKDKLSAAFRVREGWRLIRANWLGYLIGWIVVGGVGMLLYLALMILYYTLVLCCLIPFVIAPIGFYLSLVSAALFGQIYRESVALVEPQTINQMAEAA